MIDFNSPHFQKFQGIDLPVQSSWLGHSPSKWYRWIWNHLIKENSEAIEESAVHFNEQLPTEKLNRTELSVLISEKTTTIETCVISILAWGGMKRTHGASLFKRSKAWLPIATDLRNGNLNRLEAYQRFSSLRANGDLPGMGPAYFTKLIYFLGNAVNPRGYIMDQWTARSVNLLSNSPLINTSIQIEKNKKNGKIRIIETVTDANTKNNYDAFCKTLETIAQKLEVSPGIVEEMMFSEGRGKGEWRDYIVAQKLAALTNGFTKNLK